MRPGFNHPKWWIMVIFSEVNLMPEPAPFLRFLKLGTPKNLGWCIMVGEWDSNHQDDRKVNHHRTVFVGFLFFKLFGIAMMGSKSRQVIATSLFFRHHKMMGIRLVTYCDLFRFRFIRGEIGPAKWRGGLRILGKFGKPWMGSLLPDRIWLSLFCWWCKKNSCVQPQTWDDDPQWLSCFSGGLKQPMSSDFQ